MMTTPHDLDEALPREATRAPKENFPVLSFVLPRALRPGFAAVYSFCRVSDDIADDPSRSPDRRLESLRRWREELEQCFDGRPRLPMMTRLRSAAERYALPAEPFHRLLDAFEQDQVRTRYASWDDLVAYATCSANPVGELVLRIGGHRPEDADWNLLLKLSDQTCTSLQFINFWQDVRRDLLDLDRVYIPLDEAGISVDGLVTMARAGPSREHVALFRDIVSPLVERTDQLMLAAADMPNLTVPALARPVRLFQRAGLLVSGRIRAAGCKTLWRRPNVPRSALVRMTLAAMLQRRSART